MPVSRRTRLSVIAAAVSGALVVAMAAGAALAVGTAGPASPAVPAHLTVATGSGETRSTTPAAALERDPDDLDQLLGR